MTDPHILSMRIDESLYFANAAYLEDTVFTQAALREDLAARHFDVSGRKRD